MNLLIRASFFISIIGLRRVRRKSGDAVLIRLEVSDTLMAYYPLKVKTMFDSSWQV
jgi:hypothetical protein